MHVQELELVGLGMIRALLVYYGLFLVYKCWC